MIRKKMSIEYVENEKERNQLLKSYNRRNIIICLTFFIFSLLVPLFKQHLPPVLIILINTPKQGLMYVSIIITVDILLYVWLRMDDHKSVRLRNENLPKDKITIEKSKKKESKKEKMQNTCYLVDVGTSFDKEDIDYYKPIITIKHYSILNPSVEKTAVFSKNSTFGCLTLSESSIELCNIINECKASNLPFKVSFDTEVSLTNEEIQMIQNIKKLVGGHSSV